MTTGVLVVDDQALLRTAFSSLIDAEDDLAVVGQAADGLQAVALARSLAPDVVVMDVRMPVMDGIEATRQITEDRDADGPRVLILTTFDLDEYVFEALRAGASGFALKRRTCDAVAIVDHGRVIRQGPIDELVRSAGARVVRLDCSDPAAAGRLLEQAGLAADVTPGELKLTVTLPADASRETVADVNRRLVEGGISVYGLQEVHASLEDWFLSVTSRFGEQS